MKKLALLMLVILFFLANSHSSYGFETFVVKNGDNFWKLSKKHNVSWFELQKVNADRFRFKGNPNLIYEGQEFILPSVERKEDSPPINSVKNFLKQSLPQQQKTTNHDIIVPSEVPVVPGQKELKPADETSSELHIRNVMAISPKETIAAKILRKIAGIFSSPIVKIVMVGMVLAYLEPYITMYLKYMRDLYRKKTKKVFIACSREDDNFCLVCFDGSNIYIAKNKEDGLRELASFVIENCGYAETKKISFIVPGYYRLKFFSLDRVQKKEFESHALNVQQYKDNVLTFEKGF